MKTKEEDNIKTDARFHPEDQASYSFEAVGLEWGSLSLVSTTEELLGKKSSGSGVEIREYGRRDPSR
jgi:hypothetical protein